MGTAHIQMEKLVCAFKKATERDIDVCFQVATPFCTACQAKMLRGSQAAERKRFRTMTTSPNTTIHGKILQTTNAYKRLLTVKITSADRMDLLIYIYI